MDEITKFLKKRTAKERQILLEAVRSITENKLADLDLTKIKGEKNVFRIRIGKFRINFKKEKNDNFITKIDKRDEQTYR